MSVTGNSRAHTDADLAEGSVFGSVEIAASPERVFRALTSKDIVGWWIRPGVFDTTDWTGDVRVGGRWRAAGRGNGRPFVLEGEFLGIDVPRKLVLTWHSGGTRGKPTTVTFLLERIEGGDSSHAAPNGFRGTRLVYEHLHWMGNEL